MKFTRDTPSEDGYYWVYQPVELVGTADQNKQALSWWLQYADAPTIVEIQTQAGVREVWNLGSECQERIEEAKYWWSEKLEMPALPAEELKARQQIRQKFRLDSQG